MLAARDGVVAALCDHFDEGGDHESLLPRANFVALRHADGTYTRYVHLMHGGVLVRVGQVMEDNAYYKMCPPTAMFAGSRVCVHCLMWK